MNFLKSTPLLLRLLLITVISIIWNERTFSQGFDDKINEAFMPIAVWWENLVFTSIPIGNMDIPIVLILLISGASFFTIYFGFVNIRRFPTSIQVVRGKYDHLERKTVQEDIPDTIKNESQIGEVNHFQALATAISGTVGLGNIAMVAVAISIGGPGATFWMVMAGLIGMSTKFVECTLGVKYRDIGDDGQVYGGPMYYLLKGLKNKGQAKLGKVLSMVFAVMCVGASFGGGNAFQSNQAAAQIIERFDIQSGTAGTMIGVMFAILAGIVILGGIKRIAKVTEKIVPFMALLYIISALAVLIINAQYIDDAFGIIISEAFTPRATISGGIIGVIDSRISASCIFE